MIRVTKAEERERIIITIDGQLSRGWRMPDTGFQHTGPRDSGVFETLTKGLSPVNNG